jgi:hypothetical protein
LGIEAVKEPFGLRLGAERTVYDSGTGVFDHFLGFPLTLVYTVEVGSLHTPYPNTFKLSFSPFLIFNPSKNALS